MLCGERTVEMYFHDSDFFALGHQVVYGFFRSLAYGAHGDDHTVSVGCAVIVEQAVLAPGEF